MSFFVFVLGFFLSIGFFILSGKLIENLFPKKRNGRLTKKHLDYAQEKNEIYAILEFKYYLYRLHKRYLGPKHIHKIRFLKEDDAREFLDQLKVGGEIWILQKEVPPINRIYKPSFDENLKEKGLITLTILIFLIIMLGTGFFAIKNY